MHDTDAFAGVIEPYEHPREGDCCSSANEVYFIDEGELYILFHTSGERTGVVTRCGTYAASESLNAATQRLVDIKLDSNLGLFMSSTLDGSIYYMPRPGGGTSQTCDQEPLLVTMWREDQLVSQPAALAISDGGLYVADVGKRSIWFLKLGPTYRLTSAQETMMTTYGSIDLANMASGGLLSVEVQGGFLHRYDRSTELRVETVADTNSGYTAIGAVNYDDQCLIPLRFTSSNQYYSCEYESGTDTHSCTRRCSLVDAASCEELQTPTGISTDCNCDVFVASSGNSQIVLYDEPFLTFIPNPPIVLADASDGLVLPTAIEVLTQSSC